MGVSWFSVFHSVAPLAISLVSAPRGAVSVICCYIKTIPKLGVFKATIITYTSFIILLIKQEVFLVSFASFRRSFSWMLAEVGLFLAGA